MHAPPSAAEPRSNDSGRIAPADAHASDPNVVGIAPRAFATDYLARFNVVATEFLPGDDRDGDLFQLPVIVEHGDGLQCFAVVFTA